jgi:hypothetical protein
MFGTRLGKIEERLERIERMLGEHQVLSSMVDKLLRREELLLDRLMARSLPELATYGQREEVTTQTPELPSMDELIGTITDEADEEEK